MKSIVNPLNAGDVIRTHPKRGFWGCAVVLTARDSTSEFYPMCHIAILDLIRKRKYSWKSINFEEHTIVNLDYEVRVAPFEYIKAPNPRLSIGIYSLKKKGDLDIIGNIDPSKIYSKPISFEVGDGTNGNFPLRGPIPDHLGYEAVILWRKLNDQARFELESQESRNKFEIVEQKRLATLREKRKANKRT